MGGVGAYRFGLYVPEGAEELGERYLSRLPGALRVPWCVHEALSGLLEDVGEINPRYPGWQQMRERFVLMMLDDEGRPCGLCAFVPERRDLIMIDIVVVKKDLRQQGLGRLLMGYLEQAFEHGTVLYVKQATSSGRKFFMRCGFTRDVELYKVLGRHNRILKDAAVPVTAATCR
ncbi:GNAT family N-acetyltransferase [Desulfovirgula thermocuniculi]|uniref:GNAT family N-acetyltransferase n=1 Tax=Desulfovirgula thermocuniculi TaxID=348842 RepID=UPI00040ED0E8|nr:GNAT family N-acetyltransferase [Desulfovirgula thermocuniculi]